MIELGVFYCPFHRCVLDISEGQAAGGVEAEDVYVIPCEYGHDVVAAFEAVQGEAPRRGR